ncbi:hypothetical protein LOK49_LG07G03007 [Camellia lanceoleosa]|uniref:Uncharacterized protein n=1 Tax=Camellia lanceoleosa TaxID=1840588 RepID=A0ACC0H3M2_9ERIC|nr:hypothetical protein LOK49_LG07G03007 [Camellia lanceoleosa]
MSSLKTSRDLDLDGDYEEDEKRVFVDDEAAEMRERDHRQIHKTNPNPNPNPDLLGSSDRTLSHTTDRRENHLFAIHSQALVDIEPM